MSWVRIDDGFSDHWKIKKLHPVARWVHIQALCYAARYLTDGFLPRVVAEGFAQEAVQWLADSPVSCDAQAMLRQMLDVKLWRAQRGGFVINDFLEYNSSRAERETKVAERKEHAQKAAAARWSKPTDAQVDARSNARAMHGAPSRAYTKNASRPVPSPGVSVDTPRGVPPAAAPGPPPSPGDEEPVLGRDFTLAQIAGEVGVDLKLDPARKILSSPEDIEARRLRQKAALDAVMSPEERAEAERLRREGFRKVEDGS